MQATKRFYWRAREVAAATARRVAQGLRNAKLVHLGRAAILARIHTRELRSLRASLGFARTHARGPTVIAISLLEHMGDIVAAEPISRAIRRMHPDAFVVWVVRAPYLELISNNPSIDRALVVACMTEWVVLRRRGLFDMIFDLHLPKRICPVCKVPLEKSEGNPQITLDNYYEFGNLLEIECQNAGLAVFDDQPRLHIPESAIRVVDTLCLPPTIVAIHCRSNEQSRDWSKDKWCQFVTWLGERSITCIEVGIRPMLAADNLPLYMNLCGRLTILETAEVIRRATMFIGIDSGPAHLANAVDTFGIVLIGHYRRFKRMMPYSGRYRSGENAELIFAEDPAASLAVDKVIAAATRHWVRLNRLDELKEPGHATQASE